MKKAIYYFVEAVYAMYDKVVPKGKKVDNAGRVKRPGLRNFLICYLLILVICYYVLPPVYTILQGFLALAFFAAIGLSLVLYCRDGDAERHGQTIGCVNYDPSLRDMPQTSVIHDCPEYIPSDDDEEEQKEKKTVARTPGKPVKVYDSPIDEVVVNEALYGVPFDPSHEVEYRK